MIELNAYSRVGQSMEDSERLATAWAQLKTTPHVRLATCNRLEIYSGSGDIGRETARHLMEVAAGLRSAIVGEGAILGQVKAAYETARAQYALSGGLNRLFQAALHAGKRVRTETHIAEGAVGHAQAVMEIIRREFGDMHGVCLGMVGAGGYADEVIRYAEHYGIERIVCTTRRRAHAEDIARRYGAEVTDYAERRTMYRRADVVVFATAAPHTVCSVEDFADTGMSGKIVIDIAFPRDVPPEVGEIEGIKLYDLAQVEDVARRNLRIREGEVEKARRIIDEEIERLMTWQNHKNEMRLNTRNA